MEEKHKNASNIFQENSYFSFYSLVLFSYYFMSHKVWPEEESI